jgi:hypothetical protein
MQNLDATSDQSLTNCTRVSGSRMQIVPVWPPVACNMNKIDGNLHATGGNLGTIGMRQLGTLAATQVQLIWDWPPFYTTPPALNCLAIQVKKDRSNVLYLC